MSDDWVSPKLATEADLESVLSFAEAFWNEAGYKEVQTLDPESVRGTVLGLIRNPSSDVCLVEGRAAIAMMVTSPWYNRNHKIGVEVFWFVREEFRQSGLGDGLRQFAEAWAKAQGCESISFSTQATTNPAAKQYLINLNYLPVETVLTKRIT